MKQVLPILLIIFLASCSGGRKAYRNEEKDINTLINRLNKKGSDDKIIADLQEVYNGAYFKASQRMANYQYDPVPSKWDKLIPELEGLNRLYENIARSAYALRLVKPVNVYQRLIATKDSAANDFYSYASDQMLLQTREGNKEAYYAFDRSAQYVPNYRDARARMQEAFDKSIVHVLINYIEYDVMGMGNFGWSQLNNRDREYHSRIINDLGGQNSRSIPARFYDPYELRRVGLAPELVVDLVWRNIRFDQPRDRGRSYNRSKQIETGKDTANRPIYTTVYATVNVTTRELNASGDMNVIITDAETREQKSWDRIPSSYTYNYEFASYSGDRRALDDSDWTIINRNRNEQFPSREEAMAEMMRRIYDQVVSRIRSKVGW